MNKRSIQSIFLFALLVALFALLVAIFSPYASVLFWSIVLYVVCSPPYKAILKKLNPQAKTFTLKRKLLAGFFAILIVAIIAGLVFVFGFLIIKQCIDLTQKLTTLLSASSDGSSMEEFVNNFTSNIFNWTYGIVDIRNVNLSDAVIKLISKYSNSLLSFGKNFVQSAGRFIISLVFVCFSLYFFYVDGQYLLNLFETAIPIEKGALKKLFAKFSETLSQLISGLLLVGLYQGVAAFAVYTIFGVDGSLLLAMATFFATFVPIIGSGLIWFPITLILFFTGSKLKAVTFLCVAAFFIGLMDNFLRPLILKGSIKIHPLLIFFSLLGGIKLLGLKGIILGPMTIIIFFAVLDMILNTEDAKNRAIDD